MSQTAAQINQEIRDRLARGTEIGESLVYTWMNEVKRRVCTQSEPLDFMLHEAVVLLGSGSGVPGIGNVSRKAILLPRNFHSLAVVTLAAGAAITAAQSGDIFGDGTDPYLFTFPTQSTVGTYLSTEHVPGEQDLYPLFKAFDIVSFLGDLTARGIDFDAEAAFSNLITATIMSPTVSQFVPHPVGTTLLRCQVISQPVSLIENMTDTVTAMETAGYAEGPWPAKVLEINIDDLDAIDDEGLFFLSVVYSRVPWDYDSPCWETRGAPILTGDIFTETAPNLLKEGVLEQAWEYLNDEARSDRHAQRVWGNPMVGHPNGLAYEFRKQHRIAQIESNLPHRRRFKEGTRIARAL